MRQEDAKAAADARKANKKPMSDKTKKALKVGAVATGTVLAAYGAYKVSKFVSNSKVKPFSVDELKNMGISVFEPETFEPERIKF